MIVLDTNVVSEAFRTEPAEVVGKWYAAQAGNDLYVCAPVMAELRYGIERLAHGAKRDDLAQRYALIRDVFRDKILAFNLRSAEAFADILVARERRGRRIELMDAQIAAIAQTRGASIATRDVRDFEGCGVPIVDPWTR